MTTIHLTTIIYAPIQVCFDISRDIIIHLESAAETRERVVAGKFAGLLEKGDVITWEAVHFGVRQRLSIEISRLKYPYFFEDRMLAGAFRSMRHEHHFREEGGITRMTDIFEYQTPYGIFGWLFDKIVLKRYLTRFLLRRNEVLKMHAERKRTG